MDCRAVDTVTAPACVLQTLLAVEGLPPEALPTAHDVYVAAYAAAQDEMRRDFHRVTTGLQSVPVQRTPITDALRALHLSTDMFLTHPALERDTVIRIYLDLAEVAPATAEDVTQRIASRWGVRFWGDANQLGTDAEGGGVTALARGVGNCFDYAALAMVVRTLCDVPLQILDLYRDRHGPRDHLLIADPKWIVDPRGDAQRQTPRDAHPIAGIAELAAYALYNEVDRLSDDGPAAIARRGERLRLAEQLAPDHFRIHAAMAYWHSLHGASHAAARIERLQRSHALAPTYEPVRRDLIALGLLDATDP